MTQNTKPPALTSEQWRVLEQYAWFEIGLDDVKLALRDVMEFNFEPQKRCLSTNFLVPEPGIQITREHIANALVKKHEGLISERDLADWAIMMIANDAYELDPKDEDFIADWLNDQL
jgi:hypothetical protein